jgi:hypothetical protein
VVYGVQAAAAPLPRGERWGSNRKAPAQGPGTPFFLRPSAQEKPRYGWKGASSAQGRSALFNGQGFYCTRLRTTIIRANRKKANMGQASTPTATGYASPDIIPGQPGENGALLYAFIRGDDGHLYRNFWDGQTWHWFDHGTPQNMRLTHAPDAITSMQWWAPIQQPGLLLNGFVRAEDSNLWQLKGDGNQWEWISLGQPPKPLNGKPVAVEYWPQRPYLETGCIYVFGRDVDGALLEAYFDRSTWTWIRRGSPAASALVPDDPAVVVYHFGDRDKIYVFVASNDGHLYLAVGDGANTPEGDGMNWEWTDQNQPAQNNQGPATQRVTGVPAAAVWTPNAATPDLVDGHEVLLAFVRGQDDGHLYRRFWDGQNWRWHDHGMPQNSVTHQDQQVGDPAVIVYEYDGLVRPYVFVRGNDGNLYSNSWAGGDQWSWYDHQTPQNADTRKNTIVGDPAVALYTHDGLLRPYVFVHGQDGNLYVNSWDGAKWQWNDQHNPTYRD